MSRPARGVDPREARQRFLTTGESVRDVIRPEIALSWERSRRSGVNPESLPVPFEPDLVDSENRFCDVALPVMEHFAGLLEGTPTCLVLADREARGIETWVGDPALQHALDNLGARRGFRFSEDVAGTNGLGTPIETSRPIYISAGEHYVDALQSLACAGVPVRHPFTRRLEAVVDLTCAHEDPNRLLMALAREIAGQLEAGLYAQGSAPERLLLQHFMTTSRGAARGVVVVSQDMILANPLATRLLEDFPQALLWEHAAKAMVDGVSAQHELTLAGNRALLLRCVPISDRGRLIGATLELDRVPEPAPRRESRAGPVELPGLVGRSAAWRRVGQEAMRHLGTAEVVRAAITGELGVGKVSLARATLTASKRAEPAVFDGTLEAAEGLAHWVGRLRCHLEDSSSPPVLLTHLDCLSEAAVRAVCGIVDQAGAGPALVATLTVGERPVTHCAAFLDRVVRIEIPPLRQRPEDISDLVSALLGRLGAGGPERRCSPEALQAITRFAWPGNVRQLESALRSALARRDRGDIRPEDLPHEVRRGSVRRRLTQMEQAELDAILAALDAAKGNKVEAASTLGISRSTLYRKMRAFGLELEF